MRMFNTKTHILGILLLSLVVLVMPITAQETEEPDNTTDDPAVLVNIIDVELSEFDEGPVLNVNYEVTDDCILPVTAETIYDEDQNTVFILLKRDRMGEEWNCSTETVSLQNIEIQLSEPVAVDSYIWINQQLYRVEADGEEGLVLTVPNYTEMEITDVLMLSTRSMPPQFNLAVTAEYLQSCAVDFIQYMWSDENLSLINISLLFTMPDNVRCLPEMGSTTENFSFGEREGVYEITMNNRLMTYDFDTMEILNEVLPPLPPVTGTPPGVIVTPQGPSADTMKIDVSVDNFTIEVLESNPPQISLHINGVVDGCEFPISYDVTETETEINVHVYREMPVGIACPAIAIMIEENINLGSYEMGHTYTITVNGISQELDL